MHDALWSKASTLLPQVQIMISSQTVGLFAPAYNYANAFVDKVQKQGRLWALIQCK